MSEDSNSTGLESNQSMTYAASSYDDLKAAMEAEANHMNAEQTKSTNDEDGEKKAKRKRRKNRWGVMPDSEAELAKQEQLFKQLETTLPIPTDEDGLPGSEGKADAKQEPYGISASQYDIISSHLQGTMLAKEGEEAKPKFDWNSYFLNSTKTDSTKTETVMKKARIDIEAFSDTELLEIIDVERHRIVSLENGSWIKVSIDSLMKCIKYACEPCGEHTFNQVTIEKHIKTEKHIKKKELECRSGKHPGENDIPLSFGSNPTYESDPGPPGEDHSKLSVSQLMRDFPDRTDMVDNAEDAIVESADYSLSVALDRIKIPNVLQVNNIYIGDLPKNMKNAHIKYLFSRFGSVHSMRLLKENCGFINFTSPEGPPQAIQEFNGFQIEGSSIWVDYPDKGDEVPTKDVIEDENLVPIRVEGMPPQIPKCVIRKIFSKYGDVKGVKHNKFQHNCLVYFGDIVTASKAMTCMVGVRFGNEPVVIKFKETRHFKESFNIGYKLWVGGIPNVVTNDYLRKLFINYGLIQMNRIVDKQCAFLGFEHEDDSKRAIQDLKDFKVHGVVLTIKPSSKGKSKHEEESKGDDWNMSWQEQGYEDNNWNNNGWNYNYDSWGQDYWNQQNWGPNDQGNNWGAGYQQDPHNMHQEQPQQQQLTSLTEGPVGDLILTLSNCKVNNEDDSYLATSVLEYLTKSLKQYKGETMDTDVVTFLGYAEKEIQTIKQLKNYSDPVFNKKQKRNNHHHHHHPPPPHHESLMGPIPDQQMFNPFNGPPRGRGGPGRFNRPFFNRGRGGDRRGRGGWDGGRHNRNDRNDWKGGMNRNNRRNNNNNNQRFNNRRKNYNDRNDYDDQDKYDEGNNDDSYNKDDEENVWADY